MSNCQASWVYIDHLLGVVTDTWSVCVDPVLLWLCAAMFSSESACLRRLLSWRYWGEFA